MPRNLCHRRPWKAALLCVALVALAVVTTVAALPAHWHSATKGVNCEICSIAHAPALSSPVVADSQPLAAIERHVAIDPLPSQLETCYSADLGRAPPA
jgi:hypothetical protein